MKKSKRKVRNPVKTADRSIRRARSPKRIRLPLSETLNEALHRASYPTRYETEPVLIFLDEARALGQLGGGQTCDIAGVIRELDRAGYIIVPRNTWDEYDIDNIRHNESWVALVEAANK